MTCNKLICTILFGILKSCKITLFKDQLRKIFEAKVVEIFFVALFVTLNLIIYRIKSLSKVILDDSDRPNRIVKISKLHVIYSVIVI